VQVTDSANGTAGASVIDSNTATVTVDPGPADHISFSGPATVPAGVPFQVTVTVQDAFNNTVTGYTGTVHFTASDGAVANYTFTTADGGQHSFGGLVLRQAGTVTVTGTDTANPAITGALTFTVTAAAPAQLAFNVPSTITAGVPFSITVTVQDAYGNTVSGYQGTVHFALTGPAMAQADYTFTAADQGSHTFNNLVLNQPGMYTLTATDTAEPMLTGSAMFTVM
jgi:hypothetical protein